jgi:hypothetical protein
MVGTKSQLNSFSTACILNLLVFKSPSLYNRIQHPSWILPARPARWMAESLEQGTVTDRGNPASTSYGGSRRN